MQKGKYIVLEGPGGTGKSYIIECIRQICSILFMNVFITKC